LHHGAANLTNHVPVVEPDVAWARGVGGGETDGLDPWGIVLGRELWGERGTATVGKTPGMKLKPNSCEYGLKS